MRGGSSFLQTPSRKCTLDRIFKCTYNTFMDYITTTELRTKAPKLKDALAKNNKVYLVDRSKIIGVISPVKPEPKIVTKEQLQRLSSLLSSGKNYTYEERDFLRRKHMEEKYGKSVS